MWCKLSNICNGDEDVIMGIVYIPPEYTIYSSPDAFSEIENEYMQLQANFRNIFLVGDFNARTAEDQDFVYIDETDMADDLEGIVVNEVCNLDVLNIPRKRNNIDKGKNRYGNQLLELCKGNNLFILNGRIGSDRDGNLTCRKSSTVDYCLSNVNFMKNFKDLKIIDFSSLYSDVHCPLAIKLKHVSNNINAVDNRENSKTSTQKIKNWDKEKSTEFQNNIDGAKVDQLLNNLNNIDLHVLTGEDLNKLVNDLGQIFVESAKSTLGTRIIKTVPNSRTSNRGDKPWFNIDCKFARQNYRKLKRRVNNSSPAFMHRELRLAEKEYKKVLDKSLKIYRRNLSKKLKNLRSNNTKEYWQILNKRESTKQPDISFEKLLEFFKNLNSSSRTDDENIPDLNLNQGQVNQLNESLNTEFSCDEILKCIKNLKNNKVCGDDLIINEYIKSTSDQFVDIYVKLFNIIFQTGIVPESWVIGTIKPFYKNKGDKHNPKNFRPITIVSCLGKLFTAVLCERLTKFSDEISLLNENQCGFRKGYSTLDCMFTLHAFFEILKLKKKKLFCAFIDFEKAFDTVVREALWYKMLLSNITGNMYQIIHNMYNNIKSCLSYNGNKSDYFPCEKGVRQGENLSSFLFALFLNDLEDFLARESAIGLQTISDEIDHKLNIFLKIFAILYADDTILMAESSEDLQFQLNAFSRYCKQWKMKVNVEKTKIMIFYRGRLPGNISFNFNGDNIEIVKEFNYLGIVFSRIGNFKACKKRIAEKARIAMYNVIKKGRTHNLSISCQLDLFDKLVKPILLYGCEIWGFENNEILEKVQLKFCKLLLNLKSSTPNCMVYGEIGRFPIDLDIKLRMVMFWSKVLQGKESKLSYLSYHLLFKLTNELNVNSKWLKCIENILDQCGISYVWRNQYFTSVTWLKHTIKTSLQDQYKQDWHATLENSPKTIIYRMFKENFEFEKYFNILDDRDIFTLCKFRVTNHKLPIEVGRWNNVPREDRVCRLCNCGDLGDEFHYLLNCNFMSQQRQLFIHKKYYRHVNALTFKELMSVKKKSELRKLCSFIRFINCNI